MIDLIIHFRAFLTDVQREQFGEVVLFFKENVDPLSKDLAFLLGDKAGVGRNVSIEVKIFQDSS